MGNGFLSQEEINSLLSGNEQENINFSEVEKDLIGEIGNISMGSASTALSTILNRAVSITTPKVTVTNLGEIKRSFEAPTVVLDVEYTSGIVGRNLLIIKTLDAAIIANLMMGGDGEAADHELSEIEISAVSETMNQMIGSAATSMATMFKREVNISPPNSKVWNEESEVLTENISEDEVILRVSFEMKIEGLLDSTIMQILPVNTAKKIVSIMTEGESEEVREKKEPVKEIKIQEEVKLKEVEKVNVHGAKFSNLKESKNIEGNKNIDLILDVPLEVSVVLGRTKKSIKDILNLGNGSLIELNKLAEEPVEILINGKNIAYGEVVVVDENFGVRITSIVSGTDRIKSLK